MKCPKCQAMNREHRHFCRQCGVRLLLNCPQCDFANEMGDVYCGGCGKSLEEAGSSASQQKEAVRSQKKSSSSLPRTFLEEIIREKPQEAQTDAEEGKKAVSQEEIDKLFNK